METEFIRARSQENREQRWQQIMEAANRLFFSCPYGEITMSMLCREAGITRGGLYKYAGSKEEIYLKVYLWKQAQVLQDLQAALPEKDLSMDRLAAALAKVLHAHVEFLMYHQILATIIEANVSVEMLADFKQKMMATEDVFLSLFARVVQADHKALFDAYLAILAHAVYLAGRDTPSEKYIQAMEMAHLDIVEEDFEENMIKFIPMYLTCMCKAA